MSVRGATRRPPNRKVLSGSRSPGRHPRRQQTSVSSVPQCLGRGASVSGAPL